MYFCCKISAQCCSFMNRHCKGKNSGYNNKYKKETENCPQGKKYPGGVHVT